MVLRPLQHNWFSELVT